MYNDEQLHIKGFDIDWDKIVPQSYLRGITALSGLNTWTFRRPITFFVGENGSGFCISFWTGKNRPKSLFL